MITNREKQMLLRRARDVGYKNIIPHYKKHRPECLVGYMKRIDNWTKGLVQKEEEYDQHKKNNPTSNLSR